MGGIAYFAQSSRLRLWSSWLYVLWEITTVVGVAGKGCRSHLSRQETGAIFGDLQ